MTQIERRQTRIRRIRSHLEHSRADGCREDLSLEPDTQVPVCDPEVRYHIGKTQNSPEHLLSFVQKNEKDPAIKVSPVYRLGIMGNGVDNLSSAFHT